MEDLTDRVTQIQHEMREAGLDGLVLRLAENVLLVTEWFARVPGFTLAVVPAQGQAVLVVADYEAEEADRSWAGEVVPMPLLDAGPTSFRDVLGSIARKLGLTGGAIGFEGGFESLALPSFFGEPNAVALPTQDLIRASFATERLVDFTDAIEELRAVKTSREIELIRRTNEIAVFGLRAFREAAVPGATEVEVMAAVDHAIAVEGHGHQGAQWVRGYATVRSGPSLAQIGWQPFRSSTRKIERDDVVMVELGTVADGYWSDHTRTVVAGKASPAVAEAYAAVLHACEVAMDAARPGANAHEVDAAARAVCAERGFTQFPHHTGHGTGFRYHESRPVLLPDSPHVLREGQVLAIEPGIYEPALRGGVRHEIDAVITEKGAVVLAPVDDTLDLV